MCPWPARAGRWRPSAGAGAAARAAIPAAGSRSASRGSRSAGRRRRRTSGRSASTRSCMLASSASVTWSLTRLPSQSGEALTISSAFARTRSTGVVKSTLSSTAPIWLDGFPRPVLERLLDEIGERHDHAPHVPEPDHHIGRGDLLDAAGFVLDHDRVLDADRLRHRELDAGDQVREHRPGGEADDQAGDAGGGEQADAVLAHRLERHQRGADRHDDQQRVDDAPQHAHLRHMLAGEQVVGDVELEAAAGRGPRRCAIAVIAIQPMRTIAGDQQADARGRCDRPRSNGAAGSATNSATIRNASWVRCRVPARTPAR